MTALINNPFPMNRNTCIRLLTIIILLLPASRSFAQKEPLVTIDMKQAPIADVLKELEKQTGYRFYYDTTDFDSTKIDVQVQQQPFSKVLDEAFTGKDINYSIDRYNRVFIAKGEAIRTDLPPEFFTKMDSGKLASGATDSILNRQDQTSSLQVAAL